MTNYLGINLSNLGIVMGLNFLAMYIMCFESN